MTDDFMAAIRREYIQHSLDVKDVQTDPVLQFRQWFEEAIRTEVTEPNAMILATVAANGKPSARIVLLKGVEDSAFVFYTSYHSRKGRELETHPDAALTFFWPQLERQVRIEGITAKISQERSTVYFHSRPRDSQIGAWVSAQSQPIRDRAVLDRRQQEFTEKFEGQAIPKPEHWGGYAVKPDKMEFWQGRPSRLHDRIVYTLQKDNRWTIERLAP